MNYNYTFLLGWRVQLSTRKIFLSYRTRNISNIYRLFFPTFFFFFKLFDSLFSASNLFQIISSIIRLVWMITHHFSLSPAPCAFRFSTFLQLARSNTWSLKPATTTEFTNLYFITNHSFSAAFDIWATCSSQLKFTFAVLLLQPAHFKDHCPGVPCSILHLT